MLDPVVLHGTPVTLMAGLEHLWCSMPVILCVTRWQPVATGPGAEVGTLAAWARRSRSGRYTTVTVKTSEPRPPRPGPRLPTPSTPAQPIARSVVLRSPMRRMARSCHHRLVTGSCGRHARHWTRRQRSGMARTSRRRLVPCGWWRSHALIPLTRCRRQRGGAPSAARPSRPARTSCHARPQRCGQEASCLRLGSRRGGRAKGRSRRWRGQRSRRMRRRLARWCLLP